MEHNLHALTLIVELLAWLKVLLHRQDLPHVDAIFAEEVIIKIDELDLTNGRKELALLDRIERILHFEFATSTCHSTRRYQDDLIALRLEPCYLVNERRQTGDVEFAAWHGEHVRTHFYHYSLHDN